MTGLALGDWADRLTTAGRLTLNFHPDRLDRRGRTVAAGFLADGRYRSQWATGISAGSRSAMPGGERERWERALFGAAGADHEEPSVYGSLDLLGDPHGGSPRFGSSFVVLRDHVRARVTLCVGDSHVGPADVGTFDAPWGILAGLAEQALANRLLHRGLGFDDLVEALTFPYRSDRPSRDLDGYVEAQVHGGVALADDVAEVVLDPSFRGTDIERDLALAAVQYGFALTWHTGSELPVDEVPVDFRGPEMQPLAHRVARPDGMVDAHAIGLHARPLPFTEPLPSGDPPDSALQQLKYLWHTLLHHGHDTVQPQ